MNIAIVDDIPEETKPLRDYLMAYAAINSLELTIDDYESAEALLAEYRPFRYTVIFMDIYMEGMTGVEAAKDIRQNDSDTYLIFFTNSLEFMPEAFSLHAFEYMEKPVKKDRIFALLDDILKLETDRTTSPMLEFISNRNKVLLPYDNIVFIRSDGNYQEIGAKDGTIYRTRMRFTDISDKLTPDPRFLIILRGMLVNMDFIKRFSDGICYIQDNIRLPISMKNATALEQTWKNYIFQKIRREHRGVSI